MSAVGVILMVLGAVGYVFGLFAHRRVRHITSQTLWLTVSALVLAAGLALQAAADGWDISK